jgi:hypothetical protein
MLQPLPDGTITPCEVQNMRWYVKALTVGPSLIHSAVHVLGWNFGFPTHVEQLFWRAARPVLASGMFVLVGGGYFLFALGVMDSHLCCSLWIWVRPE